MVSTYDQRYKKHMQYMTISSTSRSLISFS